MIGDLVHQIGEYFASQPMGWGTIIALVVGYIFVTRIIKMIIFCVLLLAIAAGLYWFSHQSELQSYANGMKTVIEKTH